MRLEEQAPPPSEKERTSRHRSRDRIRRHEATVETVETHKEFVTKETSVEISISGNSEIRSTRIDDILKSVSAAGSLHHVTGPPTSPPPEMEDEEAPPPPPPTRTDTRDIKDILASHRSRPRRPFNDNSRQNGVKSPEPTPPPSKAASPPPTSSNTAPSSKQPAPPSDESRPSSSRPRSRPRSARSKSSSDAAKKPDPQPAAADEPKPAPSSRSRTRSPRTSSRRRKEEEKKKKDENGLPTVDVGTAPSVKSEAPHKPGEEEDALLDRLRDRKKKKPDDQDSSSAPKTPFGDDLEKQALDSLEGLTSDIIKERDQARKERDEARAKCAAILSDYGGRRQAWQNQFNVVKIRLEHYYRRHDKLRSDIVKQQEQFDIERSRMKERHANQIEGLFGDLFDKIKTDSQYVASSTGLDEVNYKLQAFMELWKGLAHDVDDLYDKEHYCLRLCETVKSLQDQIKHQNSVIAGLLKGRPLPEAKDMPDINVTIGSNNPPTTHREYKLPEFEEMQNLDSLLPDDDMFADDILAQFAPIEETFKNMDFSMPRSKSREEPLPVRTYEKPASPPPAATAPPKRRETRPRTPRRSEPRRVRTPSPPPKAPTPPPPEPEITVEVIDVPCNQSAPVLPKPSININRTIDDHNKQPDLPIKVDPEDIRKRYNLPPKQPKVEVDAAPVVQSRPPFSGSPMFDDPPPPARPAADEPPPLSVRPRSDEPATLPYNSYPPYQSPTQNGNDPTEFPTLPMEPAAVEEPKPKKKRKKKKPAKADPPPEEIPVEPMEVEPMVVEVDDVAPVQATPPPIPRRSSPSPTPSFRRRRASMESAKDFSVLGDPDLDENPLSPPAQRHSPPNDATLPKETTLDDPASQSPAPAPEKKKKKWKPSMPIFNDKLPKSKAPPPAPEVAQPAASAPPDPSADQPGPSTSNSDSVPEKPKEEEEEAPPASKPPKRAKSLPRFRDPSLPRNMASHNMKRALSNPRLKKDPGSECDSEDSDSDIRSLVESVYMPLHLTPSRSNSKKNVNNDDAKSTTSSFARRNKMPGSMGWLDSNNPPSDEDSSSDFSSSEDEDDDSDSGSEEEEQSFESDDDYEIPPIADSSTQDLIPLSEDGAGSKRNSMLDSILKDFDDNSKNWLNNSNTDQKGEMLI